MSSVTFIAVKSATFNSKKTATFKSEDHTLDRSPGNASLPWVDKIANEEYFVAFQGFGFARFRHLSIFSVPNKSEVSVKRQPHQD